MIGLYCSISDFVEENNLKTQANTLFGKDWEPEEDQSRAQQLCDFVDKGKYEIVGNDDSGVMNSDFEFEVIYS